jgi:hypothetical protein
MPGRTAQAGDGTPMNRDDKLLYHQIHPAKLAVDIATSAASAWLLWRGQLWLAMLVGWLPSVIVTAAMVRWMDFSRQRDSSFGRYVVHHMTRQATAVRLAGQLVMWLAAWLHAAWGIAVGALVVIAGWTYSLPSWRARARGGPG